jgi:predicted SAM-dependent methyltransferase
MRFLEIAPYKKRGLNWDGIRDTKEFGGTDFVWDMRKLPMEFIDDDTYNGVYSEHFIEHIERDEGINFFKEMLRIMKPGGVVRTVWPSMDFVNFLRSDQDLSNHPFVKEYHRVYVQHHGFCPPGNEQKSKQEQCALGLLWQKGEHKYLWGKQEMIDTLTELGYENVREYEYQRSSFAPFKNIDHPNQLRALHSTVVEATKPW